MHPVPPLDLPPAKRVRLMPWQGPLHVLLLFVTSTLTLLLPLAYVLGVMALGGYVSWAGVEWVRTLIKIKHWVWQDFLPLSYLAAGIVTWIFTLRPLLARPKSVTIALQATPTSQKRLFELVDKICWHLHLDPPQEVWLDTTLGIRSSVKNGVLGSAGRELILNIGLPTVSVVSAHQFAALLVRELAMNAGGLGSTFSHLVRELNVWFYRALYERDPWELELRAKRDRETLFQGVIRNITWLWMNVAKLPFAILVVFARIIGAAALTRMESTATAATIKVIGKESWQDLLSKMELLQTAWVESRHEIQRGIARQRLPENLPLLLARHVNSRLRPKAKSSSPEIPPEATAASLIADLSAESPGASLIRGFVEVSRQVTCFYYQHELGIGLHENNLVAEEEVLHQNRREDKSLSTLKRYFGGLAHPERAMCGHGLGAKPAFSPNAEHLRNEILKIREETREWGTRLKVTLNEWNLAWQRRRDLEAATLLSMAGFTISRIQFGTEDTTPLSLKKEATRQCQLMEHMESALIMYEARLQSRFSSALGLLWWVEKDQLSDPLQDRLKELPYWVSVYETMAHTLPSFRELLTSFFAFQALGTRYASLDDTGRSFYAMHTVVPKMIQLTGQILASMDGAMYPFQTQGEPALTLNQYLLQGNLPDPIALPKNPTTAEKKALSVKMAADVADKIAPFVDRFLNLYHKSYAWLAESAELTEQHFLEPVDYGADLELIMPEEYAESHETQGLRPARLRAK